MTSMFAFSYLIYSIEKVSAEEEIMQGYSCCEKTEEGDTCQYRPNEECDSSFSTSPKICADTEFCQEGCCYSYDTGICALRTAKGECSGGWDADPLCNVGECQRGCCVLGRNAFWITERNCEVKAGFEGLVGSFTPRMGEAECIFLSERDEEGACVHGSLGMRSCEFTTGESCSNTGGDFYKNIFCSDDALGTDCEAEDYKGCSEYPQDQSVYWYDSCGNREEIAEECSIFAGTICKQADGEYTCESIDCQVEIDGKQVIKKHGESWCEYEGYVGDGKDVVGSMHKRKICSMGEERIEPCEDYRNQICVESPIEEKGELTEASCRINNWRLCIEYSTLDDVSERTKKCEENPDCMIKGVSIEKFAYNLCVPKYPPGFDLNPENEGAAENANAICSLAAPQPCPVVYQKNWKGKWVCKINCDCRTSDFTKQMNDLCVSLGDCGGYVNYVGEVSGDGYSSGAGKIDLDDYKEYAERVPGQIAEPGNLSFLGTIGEPSGDVDDEGGGISLTSAAGMGSMGIFLAKKVAVQLATIPVIGGIGAGAGAKLAGTSMAEITENAVQTHGAGTKLAAEATGKAAGQAFVNALSAAVAVLAVTSIYQKFNPDMSFGQALVMGAAITIGIYVVASKGLLGGIGITGGIQALKVLGWVGLAVTVYALIIGWGKTKVKYVHFSCEQWQAPDGGDDCEKCNEGFCTDYKCRSLGKTCEVLNPGTEQERCVKTEEDFTSPRISPLLGTITEGYRYIDPGDNFARGFEILDLEENCIPEFTKIKFGIKTDKYAQCRVGTAPTDEFDEMDYFTDTSSYIKNHTTEFLVPSPEAFGNQYNLTEEEIRDLGELNFYIKCKSRNGIINGAAYIIQTCIKPGPDERVPRIERFSPVSGSFIKYNATDQPLNLWVNEPSNCKYGDEDREYEDMENSMLCQQEVEDYGLYGWLCNGTLDVSTNTNFYFKCQDISDNRNTMTQSEEYELIRSSSELEIDEILPDENVIAGVEPVTLTLEVKTSGGAENGIAKCEWEEENNGWSDGFTSTYAAYHRYPELPLYRGNYKFNIKCEDVAGNVAEGSTEFAVEVDTSGPKIARVYYDDELKVITDEESRCGYSFTDSRCRFNIENSTLMTGVGKIHSAVWQTDSTYYIKCEDTYGNNPGGCSIVVRPYDL